MVMAVFNAQMEVEAQIKFILAKTTKATATRDLQELLVIKSFKALGSGRSVRYELNFSLTSMSQTYPKN